MKNFAVQDVSAPISSVGRCLVLLPDRCDLVRKNTIEGDDGSRQLDWIRRLRVGY